MTDDEHAKHLELISSFQYPSYFFLLSNFTLTMIAKASYFGYDSVIVEESTREAICHLAKDEESHRTIVSMERLREAIDRLGKKLLKGDITKRKLQEEANLIPEGEV